MDASNEDALLPVLPASVPVELPDLPPRRDLTTLQQVRALQDGTRFRILSMLLYQSLTAKQIATRLGIPHGTAGYHLQVLEEAGLVRVIAKRAVRSMIAKYYARTALVFQYKLSEEVTGIPSMKLQLLTQARDEMVDVLATTSSHDEATPFAALLHLQVAPDHAAQFEARLRALIAEFAATPRDPSGIVYGISAALFRAPTYLQRAESLPEQPDDDL